MLINSYKTSNPNHPYLHLRLRTSSANPRNNMQQMESKEVRYSEKAACGKGLDEFTKCCPNGTPRNRNMTTRNTDPLTIPIDSGLPRGHTLLAYTIHLLMFDGLPTWTTPVSLAV